MVVNQKATKQAPERKGNCTNVIVTMCDGGGVLCF